LAAGHSWRVTCIEVAGACDKSGRHTVLTRRSGGALKVSEHIHELIEQHHAFYEVQPYYIVQEDRTHKATTRIQAGFDVDVYGIKPSHEQHPGRDYVLGYVAVEKLVEMILLDPEETCSVEVIPFFSTVVLDTKREFQEEGMLRIRITHKNLQPAGAAEERVLQNVKERLRDLGLSQR
jgi:hypothetical protein